ncbi:hypothetical protein Nepgr_015428 [Nepenthes gracilis]|uniref:Uncharacterized protein n=1 Tax=Nepenthes gracilis TaxID=150966 RepID=A0AAD3XQD6_NEPGR|nr:hypothetical protein Nepgr_015428 [Nepenthes gracilis]
MNFLFHCSSLCQWEFAFLSLGRPEYLQDSDIVSSRFQRRDVYGAWEQYLGLEHPDIAPKRAYAANQNRHGYEKPVKIYNQKKMSNESSLSSKSADSVSLIGLISEAFCILLEAALKDAKQSKDGTDVEITTLRCEVENAKQEAKAVAAQLHGGVGLHDFGAWLPSMALADAKVELTCLVSALGEKTIVGFPVKTSGTIKDTIDLWNLMDTPDNYRHLFDHVTCNISSSVDEVTIPGALALDLIEQAEVEVERLDQLKFSRMKEIAFKKQAELEEIYAHAHKEIDAEAAREKILQFG